MDDIWNWTTSLPFTLLPEALNQAASVTWSSNATPISHVVATLGTLDNDISWLHTRSFDSKKHPILHAILGSRSTNQASIFSTVEQALCTPSPLGNLALARNQEGQFVKHLDAPKPFHFGPVQSFCFLPDFDARISLTTTAGQRLRSFDSAVAASFAQDLDREPRPARLHSSNNLSLAESTFHSWDHPHFVTPTELALAPDVRGDWKATSSVHDDVKTIAFVDGFGTDSLVLNPSPPTCHRLDHHGISKPLDNHGRLARTFHRGSLIAINFYARVQCIGDVFDIKFIPTEWTVIAQSKDGLVLPPDSTRAIMPKGVRLKCPSLPDSFLHVPIVPPPIDTVPVFTGSEPSISSGRHIVSPEILDHILLTRPLSPTHSENDSDGEPDVESDSDVTE